VAEYKETLDNIDSAISEHIKANRSKGSVITGWVLVASVSDAESVDKDGYIMQSSSRLPHHTQLGLLQMAIEDKRNISMMSTFRAMMGDE
jgi:hypothetical protein